ncbi:MAG: histidine--tRNA ligase [Clostridia bacterium]|nr:histidine--tRNA ligase [Clostridia bacterium]
MISIPKGTKDVLPAESYKWHYVERLVRETAAAFGWREIRTPTFEHTELFLRGVGETTDIVNKEMYTFQDKGNRSVTLKCEGTAGVARAYIENGLESQAQPTKMYYITPVFRYEKPQSGRLREHHQFGVELFGTDSPYADAEVITTAKALLEKLGIKELELYLNSIGCPVCRGRYNAALKEYFEVRQNQMCPTCRERLTKNPLRILDCKVPSCGEISKDAPVILDYICDDCRAHHEKLQEILTYLGITYKVNPRIVRGLDYYTKTVFEFVSGAIGAQGTVCGGGRYNNLVAEIGGKPTPAVGFGMGLERLIMVAEAAGLYLGEKECATLYIAPIGEEQVLYAYALVQQLRAKGIAAETDISGRSLKAQMKYADKSGAKFVIVLGDAERQSGIVKLKEMSASKEEEITIDGLAKRLGR